MDTVPCVLGGTGSVLPSESLKTDGKYLEKVTSHIRNHLFPRHAIFEDDLQNALSQRTGNENIVLSDATASKPSPKKDLSLSSNKGGNYTKISLADIINGTNTGLTVNTSHEEMQLLLEGTDVIGNDFGASVQPFLAETDTLYSTEISDDRDPVPYEANYKAMDDTNGKFDILTRWGVYSPYHKNPMFPSLQRYKSLPSHCHLRRVVALHRTGAHMPVSSNGKTSHFASWFHDHILHRRENVTFDGPLSFLNAWNYTLEQDNLIRAGFQQMIDSGVRFYYRYGGIFNPPHQNRRLLMRSSPQRFVYQSAKAWALGFTGNEESARGMLGALPKTVCAPDLVPDILHTLQAFTCDSLSSTSTERDRKGSVASSLWIRNYLRGATDRLQQYARGVVLSPELLYAMQELCAFETYALGMSEFCNLFSRNEWDSFEYAHDLDLHGRSGFGSSVSKQIGACWCQELISRIMGAQMPIPIFRQKLITDQRGETNQSNVGISIDFSHESLIVSVLTALNFTIFNSTLSPFGRNRSRKFISSHITPFAARLIFEVVECEESSGDESHFKELYVRTILNDALLPMSSSQGCHGHQSDKDGMCPMDKFIKFIKEK